MRKRESNGGGGKSRQGRCGAVNYTATEEGEEAVRNGAKLSTAQQRKKERRL